MNCLLKATNIGLQGKNHNPVFKDINFEINPGEMIVIFGKTNSGKSRLAEILSGVVKPSQGWLEKKCEVTVVTQEFTLYKDLSARENLEFICTIYDTDPAQLENLLNLSGLSIWEKIRAGRLPFGIKKMLQVAAGIAQKTPLLIMDEPTIGMDQELQQRFWRMMDKLVQESRGLIILNTQQEMDAHPARFFTLNKSGLIQLSNSDTPAIKESISEG